MFDRPVLWNGVRPNPEVNLILKAFIGLGAACMALVSASASQAQSVYGDAVAMDGDSLTVSGRPVRLFGIDAPEFDQTCQKDGQPWACGVTAKEQLSGLVAGQRVECQGQGVDQHGRVLAVCFAGGFELNRTMVEQGWALAYREFSDDYVSAELQAKRGGLGIWSSQFVLPWDFRHSKLPPSPPAVVKPRMRATPQPPTWKGGCLIKGNRNRRGEWIYHLPGMPYYEQTRAEEMFCTEAEARAAGYRRAIVRQ